MNVLMKSAVAAFAVAFAVAPAFARVENLRIPGQYENLAAILTMPDNVTSNIPVVIFCHGFLSHKNGAIAVKLTEQLVPNGIATLRFDFTGHGDNDHAMFPKMTVPNEIADTINVYNYLRTRPEFGKIALGGHSQGGVVAAMTAGQLGADKISGLAIWAAASVLKDDAIRGHSIFYHVDDPSNPPELTPVEDGRRYLGRDFFLTAQTLPIFETAAKYRGGACVINAGDVGGSDGVVPVSHGQRFHAVMVGSSLHLIPGEGHNFHVDERGATAIGAKYFIHVLKGQ